jgi:uncharacterized spore protein YtfJ
VKPVGVIIVDEQGVRLARIPEKASGLERLGDAIVHVVDKRKRDSGDED